MYDRWGWANKWYICDTYIWEEGAAARTPMTSPIVLQGHVNAGAKQELMAPPGNAAVPGGKDEGRRAHSDGLL